MSRLLCCLRARRPDMGAALSHPQEGDACDGAGVPAAPPTMADVIRERKKKAAGSGLGTLRRRIALVRRPRDSRPDRGCEHARFIRSVVSSWRLVEVFLLCEELEAGAALRDLATQADLAREPARALHADLAAAYKDRWWCDVELVGAGWSVGAHRAVLAARCTYFRELLQRHPPSAPGAAVAVPLEGPGAGLSRAELELLVAALYAGAGSSACASCRQWDRNAVADGDLDIINMDGHGSWRGGPWCGCGRSPLEASALRRLGAALGFSLDSLHRDMRYLLDSGEMADSRLVFRLEGGCGAAYGFRTALELPCHRLLLGARSRFFRSVMSRRSSAGGTGSGAVCVDEKVLPRRFARALLHAAYTDTVDLGLIGRNSSSPSATNSAGSGAAAWSGASRGVPAAALDDAFQLYEIARFLEMPIVVQGCEDAIVEALSAETLPHVLRWAAAPHASHWVHRQAMRYLRDEFAHIMSSSGCGRIPGAALADALGSPFLQASEPQVLRALLRWAADQPHDRREPSAGRRGGRGGRRGADGALRLALAPLAPLLRLEHLPPDHELLSQVVRRGIVAAPAGEGSGLADAWLARGSYRPPRCFLPYLDEIKALLEDQAVPEAELARARRERYLHRIPDTLYMVAAARNGGLDSLCAPESSPAAGAGAAGTAAACVSPRVLAALRARAELLRAAPPAARALRTHAADRRTVHTQIALRTVREMSLPDTCAELLLADLEGDPDSVVTRDRERSGSEQWERGSGGSGAHDERWRWPADCCRTLGVGSNSTGSARCASAGSLLQLGEAARGATCRREMPSRSADCAPHRASVSECGGPSAAEARLSAAVPDVAMAPNANTHLLTARDYFRLAPWEYSGGGVLQLDLGDGATHTPRPGSRAQRASAARPPREHHAQAMSCLRSRADEDELRAAIELSVMRAYSSFGSRAASAAPGNVAANLSANLAGNLPCNLSGNIVARANVLNSAMAWRTLPLQNRTHNELQLPPTHMPSVSRVSGSSSRSSSPGASPRRGAARPSLRRPSPAAPLHDYRAESQFAPPSRGHSPGGYS